MSGSTVFIRLTALGAYYVFWTLRVGAYSRWALGAYYIFTIFSKCSMFILQQNKKC